MPKSRRSQGSQSQITAAYKYQAPLPPASDFEHYNNALPGAAERILSMAENQAKHRQELEKIVISAGSRDSLLGLIFGFILGLSGIAGSIYLVLKGAGWFGVSIGGASLVSLVSVFIYGSRERRKEREAKAQSQF